MAVGLKYSGAKYQTWLGLKWADLAPVVTQDPATGMLIPPKFEDVWGGDKWILGEVWVN